MHTCAEETFLAGLGFTQDDIPRKLSVRRKLVSNPAGMPISRKLLNADFIQDGRAKGSSPPVRRKLSQLDQDSIAVGSGRNYRCGGIFCKSVENMEIFSELQVSCARG